MLTRGKWGGRAPLREARTATVKLRPGRAALRGTVHHVGRRGRDAAATGPVHLSAAFPGAVRPGRPDQARIRRPELIGVAPATAWAVCIGRTSDRISPPEEDRMMAPLLLRDLLAPYLAIEI